MSPWQEPVSTESYSFTIFRPTAYKIIEHHSGQTLLIPDFDEGEPPPLVKKCEPEPEPEPVEESILPPFRFLDLPSEIRNKIYSLILFSPTRINPRTGLPKAPPASHRISLFLTSHQIHDEASYIYYSAQKFRIFQIQDYLRVPTLRSLPPRYRPCVTTLELILGSSWTAPPKSWTVSKRLGLHEMKRVRTLKIFVQCDPSHPAFEGFRVSRDYYTWFAGELLKQVLLALPDLVQVEFDGNPSVEKDGSLMSRLRMEVGQAKKKILWGPQRGWKKDDSDDILLDDFRAMKLNV
ncbi:hypothetical protein FQN54_004964 [Arachnomyces sp. PD_36]|nr:hypothetical protein FQN54_004964 [Arachnomyces sp. PD_36]